MEKIRKTGEEQVSALKDHMAEVGPALNYKKADQVWDNYYKTMYTLKWVWQDTKATRQQAADIIQKVSGKYVVANRLLQVYRSYNNKIKKAVRIVSEWMFQSERATLGSGGDLLGSLNSLSLYSVSYSVLGKEGNPP